MVRVTATHHLRKLCASPCSAFSCLILVLLFERESEPLFRPSHSKSKSSRLSSENVALPSFLQLVDRQWGDFTSSPHACGSDQQRRGLQCQETPILYNEWTRPDSNWCGGVAHSVSSVGFSSIEFSVSRFQQRKALAAGWTWIFVRSSLIAYTGRRCFIEWSFWM